jgi:hypothetical protein
MTLQEDIEQAEFMTKDRRILNEAHTELLRGFSYFVDVYDFAKKLEEFKRYRSDVDDLHRFLFKETKYKHTSFRYQIRKNASAIEDIGRELRAYEFDNAIVSHLQQRDFEPEWDAEILPEILEGKSMELSDEQVARRGAILSEAIEDLIGPYESPSRERIIEGRLGLLDQAADLLRQLDEEYESRLTEDGLEDGEGGTLGITTIVGLALLVVVFIAYMLLGFGIYSADSVGDGGEILASLGGLAKILIVANR